MNFDWLDFLDLAKWLNDDQGLGCSEEASCRAAISRAYYAAFQYAMEYAIEYEGYRSAYNSSNHQKLPQHFHQKNNKIRNSIFTKLGRLRDNRIQADYEGILNTRPDALSTSALSYANAIIDAIKQIESGQA
jgi:hypothetical protein